MNVRRPSRLAAPARRPEAAGCEALTASGRIVRIRPVRADDLGALQAHQGRTSERSRYLRFFSMSPAIADDYLARAVRAPDDEHLALLAQLGDDVVGVAGYERTGEERTAEVALMVEDGHQGEGIGTLLLEHLAAHARTHGIDAFEADTLVENGKMLRVFDSLGLPQQRTMSSGVIRTVLSTRPDDNALLVMDERDEHAEIASLRPLLAPESVAVVGAGRSPGGVGHEVLRNILDGGYDGPVYVVNPHALEVAGRPSYARLTEVPAPVDLAVVAVPAPEVADVVRDCVAHGVRAAVVLTAGLGETGPEGAALERRIVHLARAGGMRLVGPNCIGLVNNDPQVQLNASFAATRPRPGRLAIATQSGAVGIAVGELADRAALGVASLVSLGNKADVSGNDLLLRWWRDPRVGVIALYLESLGNPRKFGRLARRVGREKPVLVVKSGRTVGGQRAGASHTAAAASPDVAVDALFAQAGVLRMETVEELVETARVLDAQPVPAGGRLAVIGNAGGVGVLAADAAQGAGLTLPDNAVDLGARADPPALRAALDAAVGHGDADAVLVVIAATATNDVAGLLREVARTPYGGVTAVAVVLGLPGVPALLHDEELAHAVPVFDLPEPAVRALGRAAGYGRWRRSPQGALPDLPDVRTAAARQLVAGVLAGSPGGRWLSVDEATRLLACFGVEVVRSRTAHTLREAVAAARELGFPVALKTADRGVVHKTEHGAVRLGLRSAAQVRDAYRRVRLAYPLSGVVLSPMVAGDVELVAGLTQQATFGPVAMFGLGGVHSEVLGDRVFRMLPLTDRDAAAMVSGLRASPLLEGYRGAPRVDTDHVAELLLRVSRLGTDLPEVAELELNPVLVRGRSILPVDVKVRLAPAPERLPEDLRRLR